MGLAIPFASMSVKALRGLDRRLRSGWWLDMRSMRFSILMRIDVQNESSSGGTLCNALRARQSAVSIVRVAVKRCFFTVELTLLLKVSFQ